MKHKGLAIFSAVVILALTGFWSGASAGQPAPELRLPVSANVTDADRGPGDAVAPPAEGAGGTLAEDVWVDDGYCDGCGNDGHTWGTDAFATIQAGIDAVTAGGKVNVAAGTYIENLWINKGLELSGAGAEAVTVYPAVSLPNPCAGSSLCGSRTAASNIILTEANGITIHGFTLDGNNISLTGGYTCGGVDIDARNGIVEYYPGGVFDGLEVYDTTVKNIYLRGIYAASGGSGFNLHDNTVQNVQCEGASIAIFNFGGSGVIEDNSVTDVNDAISANWSTGTQFLNNTVVGAASGVHTDNSGNGAGAAVDLIQGNSVSACKPDGYGIFVFTPYLAVSVDQNSVSGCHVGLTEAGQYTAVTPTFTRNTVDGLGSGLIGAYITTAVWGYTSGNVSASFESNVIQNNAYGIYFESQAGFGLETAVYGNSLTGNTYGTAYENSGTIVADASANWWGSADPGTVATTVGAGTVVDYTPWLASGLDTSADPGFQGDFSTLWVDDDSPQVGTVGRVQEGVNLVSGSTVNVAPGLYVEDVSISKSVELVGPKAAVPRNTGSATDWTSATTAGWTAIDATAAGEAVIRSAAVVPDGVLDVADDCNVTVKGFVIEARNRTDGTNAHLIYVDGKNAAIQTVTIENNIIGPVTGDAQDGSKGRFGLAFDSQGGGPNGLAGSVRGNKILGAEGNGANAFVIGQHYYPSMSDYSGMVIESNDVYGANRAGMELAGGIRGLTVRNNAVTYNGLIWNGTVYVQSARSAADPTNILYGAGVNLIRTGTICGQTPDQQNAIESLVLSGNTITNNEKSGVYVDAQQRNVTIAANIITDNGRDGIWLDEYGTYNESKLYNEAYGYIQGVSVLNNTITGSDAPYAAVRVTGKPPALVINENNLGGNGKGALQEDGPGQTWAYIADASANWWGDATPVGVAARVGADVDYTSWLASGTDTGDPGFQGDFSTLWVDDDSPQTGAVGRVQEGINLVSGSTVYVAAGTYPEPVNIEGRAGLTISGENKATVIMQPTSTLCTDVVNWGCDRTTVFRVVTSTDVVLENMTFDFSVVRGNNVLGLLVWDSTCTVDNNILKNMSGEDASGYYYEITSYVRAPSYTDGARAQVAFTGNSFIDTGRLGIVTHDFVHTTITGNTFHKVYDDFGYAMEIGSRSTATISTNVIDGYDTPAASDGSESAGIYIENCFTAGMGPLTKNVSLTGNEVFGNQWGVYIGNEWETYAGDVDIVVTATGNNLHDNIDGAVYITDEEKEDGSSVTYTGSGNALTNNGGYGYSIYTAGDGAITVLLAGETISGQNVGISLEDGGAPSGSSYDVEIHNSSITGNTTYGVQNEYSGTTIDAERNWWGEACGPVSPANVVAGNVDYTPWWSNAGMTVPGPIAGAAFTVPTGFLTPQTQAILDCAGPGSTVTFEGGSYPGGLFVNNSGLTLKLNACTVGGPAPAFTIVGDDEVIQGPGTIGGGGGLGVGILVQAGADNFILENAQVTGWDNAVQLAGDVTSFKVVGNWIHTNAQNGLLIDAGVDLAGVVTIEGNLFKVNGGNGIQHNGNGTLPAEYNSWGDIDGYSTGDGKGGDVDADPFTYVESFFDVWPDGLVLERHVPENTSFDVALMADAVNVYGLTFKFTYDTARLFLNSTTFAGPWAAGDRCFPDPDPALPPNTVSYVCQLYAGDAEWTAVAGTIATFHFTALTLPGDAPLTTNLDISHLELDTSAGAIGGQKIFVNNAGFNAPSAPARDITDDEDGRIIVERLANYTGFVDLQGRTNDSGALLEVHAASTYGSTLLAQALSASSGAYTTASISPYWLGIGNTYWFQVNRRLYLPTTVLVPLPGAPYAQSKLLSVPLTALAKVTLLGGDASDDERIIVGDLSCIGGNYGGSGIVCGSTGWTDVNEDGKVNVQDLSMAGGNLYKTSSPWTP